MTDLLLNLLVVFEAHRIKGMTLLWAAEAANQLVIRVRSGNKYSHTDSISVDLATYSIFIIMQ